MNKIEWTVKNHDVYRDYSIVNFTRFPNELRGAFVQAEMGQTISKYEHPLAIYRRIAFKSTKFPELFSLRNNKYFDYVFYLPGTDRNGDGIGVTVPKLMMATISIGLDFLNNAILSNEILKSQQVLGDNGAETYNRDHALFKSKYMDVARTMVTNGVVPKEAFLTVKLFGRWA